MPVLQHATAPAATVTRPNRLLDLIPRWRWGFFVLVAVLMVLSFNGQWRVGRDSAAYRGLGHQLATTGRYIFRDKQDAAIYSDQQDTRYPGLPMMLAGTELAFGRSDRAAVLVVMLMAVATLVLSYRLARPALPAWLAVAVVFGMGANGRFLEHGNEILSDIPFLLGVVASLLAFDRLMKATSGRSRVLALTLLVIGLLFAAAMRPTFWVLAIALAATCAWGLIGPTHAGQSAADRRSRRLACALTLGVLALAAITFLLAVDLRGRHAAGYEAKLRGRYADFEQRILTQLPQNAYAVFEETLPEAFFGTQMGPRFIPVGGGHWVGFSTLLSVAVIASGVWLLRRNVLWGLLVLVTIGTMAAIGGVPRYFIMILPLLLAGWGLFVAAVADRARHLTGAREVVAFVGLGLVVAPNLLGSANLIREQRGFTRPQQGLKQVGFLQAYHGGKWMGVYDVANMVREHVPSDQRVFGPEATVLTFLADREVFGLGMFLPRKDRDGKWERLLRKNREQLAYGVFPDGTDKLYDDKDVVTGKLIRLGMLKPTRTLASAGGYRLCEYEVVPVAKKKHGGGGAKHQRDLVAATQPKATRHRPAATTQPTTGSATQPAKPPRRRRHRPVATTTPVAATRPTTMPARHALGQ
ncbi:MAG TPA: hypothetical protein VH475_05910 [Tepidisphaeraceae bacterium]|jgi:4-amino-4-deoxy-L-arabinose transferase-like glycosyltransferase